MDKLLLTSWAKRTENPVVLTSCPGDQRFQSSAFFLLRLAFLTLMAVGDQVRSYEHTLPDLVWNQAKGE